MRWLFVLIACLYLLPTTARGDGKAFRGVDVSSYRVAGGTSQVAFIACDGLEQRMLIAVDVPLAPDESAVWIVPIRARADAATLSLLDGVPRVVGRDPRARVGEALGTLGSILRATQVWPFVGDMFLLSSLSRGRGYDVGGAIERFGLRSELVTATSLDALASYLKENGVELPVAQLASFEPYLNAEHCLAVTRVASRAALDAVTRGRDDRTFGLLATFPSAAPWYPMRATSGYGKEAVPVTVYVAGLWATPLPGERPNATVDHFRTDAAPNAWSKQPPTTRSLALDAWLGPTAAGRAFDYTRVSLWGVPADRFTDDFDFAPTSPPRYAASVWLIDRASPWWIVPLGVAAVVATLAACGALAGRFVGGSARAGAIVGASGLLTLLAVHFVLRDLKDERVRRLHVARRGGIGFRVSYTLLVLLASLAVSYGAARW